MNAEDLNAIHGNPDNWHFLFFYFAPEDPRIVVRKRLRTLGWTLNFARPLALPFLAALIASVCASVYGSPFTLITDRSCITPQIRPVTQQYLFG